MAVTFGSLSFEIMLAGDGFIAPQPTDGAAQQVAQTVWDAVAATHTAVLQQRVAGWRTIECVADLAYSDWATFQAYQAGGSRTLEDYPLASGTADITGAYMELAGQMVPYVDAATGQPRAVVPVRFTIPK